MSKSISRVVFALFVFLACTVGAFAKGGAVHVNGYTRKDGTYVAPHYRSAPNGTKADNWSTEGNVNPYTGKAGTKPLDPHDSSTTDVPTAIPAAAPATLSTAPASSIDPTKTAQTNTPHPGIYFTKYENLTREQLLAKVTELDQKNAQLANRIAELESSGTIK